MRRAVLEVLRVCAVPLRGDAADSGADAQASKASTAGSRENPGLVELDMRRFSQWADDSISSGLIRGYFEMADTDRLIVDIAPWADALLQPSRARRGQRPRQPLVREEVES